MYAKLFRIASCGLALLVRSCVRRSDDPRTPTTARPAPAKQPPTRGVSAEVTASRTVERPWEPLVVPAQESLDHEAWLLLVEELVALIDHLDARRDGMPAASASLVEHVQSQLTEILERNGVALIDQESRYDPVRHRSSHGSSASPGTAVALTLRPGFAVGKRVLSRAFVKLDAEPRPDGSTI